MSENHDDFTNNKEKFGPNYNYEFETIEKCQEEILNKSYIIDVIYSWNMITQSNAYERLKIICHVFTFTIFLMFLFGIIPFDLASVLKASLIYPCIWILIYGYGKQTAKIMDNIYLKQKEELSKFYFAKISGIENLSIEERNKIFEERIIPYAGIQINK